MYLKIFEKFEQIPASLLVTLTVALSLLLFLPQNVADSLAVFEFRESYKIYLGPTLLLLFSFIFARLIAWGNKRYQIRIHQKNRVESLSSLTSEEKGYLAEFILQEKNTINVGVDDGIMGGLVAKKICYPASQMFGLLDGRAHNLQPWARKHLNLDPSLLEGQCGQPMTPQQKLHQKYQY